MGTTHSLAGRLGAETRHRPGSDTTALRRDLTAARIEEYVRRTLADAPPLTDQQRAKIAGLLTTPGGEAR